ncbi:hypothetical protein DQ04_09511000, partial [Trypanosoma grayi]|uniref:hypothetical protein n=1 Tax=Trypanosoma grayi TaxID=71804 RepID=UPI0004F46E80
YRSTPISQSTGLSVGLRTFECNPRCSSDSKRLRHAATSSLAGNFTAPSQQPSDLPEASLPLRMQYGEPDLDVFLQLMPCIVWAIAFLGLRVVCQRGLSWLGLYLQVVVPKTSCG